jgi:hypothetical protein
MGHRFPAGDKGPRKGETSSISLSNCHAVIATKEAPSVFETSAARVSYSSSHRFLPFSPIIFIIL